jgi:mycofactocin system FadH/OYE family oxidoreductase 1
MRLLEPLTLGSRTAPNRVVFGPHVTNLGDDDRGLTARHVAYYERRARGGCGTIVVEGASVHESDWPYERAPLAARCDDGWASIAEACHAHGALVLASLDHAGGQGSSAYSQAALWAPSRVPEVNSREVPKWMEADDVAAVIAGFADAAGRAVRAGCDGVEINAGQHSLIRQFLSGLTNHRGDEWGEDRLRFATSVVDAVRAAVGDAVVGLRLSCDELAPWAGITPEMAPDIAARLAGHGLDHIVVVRGSIFSAEKTRPDFHEPPGFNVDVCRAVSAAVAVPVVLQGSIVEVGHAEWALGGHGDPAVAAAVEMTRAQIADPDLVAKVRSGGAERVRPCTRCNQTCQVRDARNPIVTCVGEPSSGRETEDPDWYAPARTPRRVDVIGGGPAGLETARVAALRGHSVHLHEREDRVGGLAVVAGPHAPIVDWLDRECRRAGVVLHTGSAGPTDADLDGSVVVQCTGSIAGEPPYPVAEGAVVLDVVDVRVDPGRLPGDGVVVLVDPIGGPIAVALAEDLGDRAILVTQDNIAGNELSRSGDLAPANVRLAQHQARIERRTIVRSVEPGDRDRLVVEVEDRFAGTRRRLEAAAVVDCGFRLPGPFLEGAALAAGDCVAPRTLHEAVLEGRRAALAVDHVR